MCFHSKDKAQKVHAMLMEADTAVNMALLIGTVDAEGKKYGTCWFVKVTDRQAIANIQADILKWHSDGQIKNWDFTWVNEKREQFGLPPITDNSDYESDRERQQHPSDPYIAKIIESQKWPTEDDAMARMAA